MFSPDNSQPVHKKLKPNHDLNHGWTVLNSRSTLFMACIIGWMVGFRKCTPDAES